MKKLFTLLSIFIFGFAFVKAQSVDVKCVQTSPMVGQTITPQAFVVDFTLTNEGKTLGASDSIIFGFKLNTSWLTDTATGNSLYLIRPPANWSKGMTISRQFNFRLIDNGNIPSSFDFCTSLFSVRGPSGTDSNPANDESCNMVNWNPAAGIGAVHAIALEDPVKQMGDQIMLELENFDIDGNVRVNVIDMSGRQVFNNSYRSNNHRVNANLDFSSFPEGVYILNVTQEKGLILNQKIILY